MVLKAGCFKAKENVTRESWAKKNMAARGFHMFHVVSCICGAIVANGDTIS
jgi:hypothetical protein